MKPRLLTLLFLVAAITLYFAGLVLPAVGLVLLGAVFELVFWVRFLGGMRERENG